MTLSEKHYLESIDSDLNLFWVPGSWFVSNLQEAINEGTLTDSIGIKLVMEVNPTRSIVSAIQL